MSTYSGRPPESFDAVTELLEQARLVPSLKVLLVVRTVDLEQDPRLRHLLSDASRVTSLTIGDLDPEAVRNALHAADIDVTAMTDTTLQLLRVPLHFAVFSRLSPEAQRIPYRTLSECMTGYTSELRQQVERHVGHLDWAGITATLVDHMNEHETLLAPLCSPGRSADRRGEPAGGGSVPCVDAAQIVSLHPTLYHMAEDGSWPSIRDRATGSMHVPTAPKRGPDVFADLADYPYEQWVAKRGKSGDHIVEPTVPYAAPDIAAHVTKVET